MKKTLLFLGTVAAAIVGGFLRDLQLSNAFDDKGLPLSGQWILLAAVSAAVLLVIALLTRLWTEDAGGAYTDFFRAKLFIVILEVAAGGLIIAGNLAEFLDPAASATMFRKIILLLGMVSGLCCVPVAAAQYRGTKPSPWLYLLPVAFCILQLISHFKGWNSDPVVLDYCFKLFAEIFLMIGLFYVGGYAFDKGRYRWSIFFCLGALYFAGVTMADGGLSHIFITGGSALYLMAHLLMLLQGKKSVPEE